MKHVAILFGTRPEAIKMIPVIKALQQRPEIFSVSVVATAQHREMLDQVLDCFSVTPDIDLNIMKKDQSLFDVTCDVLRKTQNVFNDISPDIVLVHGDTTTTFASSLAAFYQKIAVGHVEAGLRTYNKYSPWPEEMNRALTGVIADYHFAPTEHAKNNLLQEHVPENNIWITGNTAIDTLQLMTEKQINSSIHHIISSDYVLVTAHRRENFGRPFENICMALSAIAAQYPDITFVYPVHLNPNIKKNAHRLLGKHSNILLTAPCDFIDFVPLMKHSRFIITDSGGIQEEATAFCKPVILLRETTERPEAVSHGTTILTGHDKEKIIAEASQLIEDPEYYEKRCTCSHPFGNGTAAEQIADILEKVDDR